MAQLLFLFRKSRAGPGAGHPHYVTFKVGGQGELYHLSSSHNSRLLPMLHPACSPLLSLCCTSFSQGGSRPQRDWHCPLPTSLQDPCSAQMGAWVVRKNNLPVTVKEKSPCCYNDIHATPLPRNLPWLPSATGERGPTPSSLPSLQIRLYPASNCLFQDTPLAGK